MPDETRPDPLRLAELLAARLCHDLSGPIGPMAGMLELARDDPEMAEEALAGAADSAASLAARLRLLRAAWSGDGGPMDAATLGALFAGGLASRRVRADLSGLAPAPIAPATARLLLNALLLAVDGLPGGGVIACAGEPDGDILITLCGPRAAWPTGLAACLADPAQAAAMLENPRQLQIPFTALLASRPGPRLSLLFAAADSPPPLLISHRDP